jgi:hypothetical protein
MTTVFADKSVGYIIPNPYPIIRTRLVIASKAKQSHRTYVIPDLIGNPDHLSSLYLLFSVPELYQISPLKTGDFSQ